MIITANHGDTTVSFLKLRFRTCNEYIVLIHRWISNFISHQFIFDVRYNDGEVMSRIEVFICVSTALISFNMTWM